MGEENTSLREMLQALSEGQISVDDAQSQIAAHGARTAPPVEELGFAAVDHARAERQGFPEVIYGASKTPEQIALIARALHEQGSTVLATRCSPEAAQAVRQVLPAATYDSLARIISLPGPDAPSLAGLCGIICAGTSDLPVALEAQLCLQAMGGQVLEVNDVGVAGLHRLGRRLEEIRACDVLIVVAGMEGALPSVIGGLVSMPVIAVPTSVGYGANFGGLSALLGMLNSCASGIAVVNIDNGFGAAAFAASILRKIHQR